MYSKLDGPGSLFRLLHLLPGDKIDKLECKLEVLSLDHTREFEALSYVWGDPSGPLSITLDGQAVNVTRSLHLALRYLRYPDRIRTLWVDAVCINQEDVNEKNHQVRLMGRIYSTAKEVVVWLGEGKDKDLGLIRFINTVGNDSKLHWIGLVTSITPISLYFFLKNPWWYRIWTAQEAVLAQKLTYQYGDCSIQGAAMHGMLHSFSEHVSTCCIGVLKSWAPFLSINELSNTIRLHQTMEPFLHQTQSRSFCQAVTFFRHRSATNPLDKIYGLLGIIEDAESMSVDYGLSVLDAYEKIAREILANTRRLDLFSHLIQSSVSSRNSRINGLPSWAPDWNCEFNTFRRPSINTEIRVRTLGLFNACGSHDYDPLHGDVPGSLRLRGIAFDEITTISQSISTDYSLFCGKVIRDWRIMAQIETSPDNPYPSGGTLLDAFWRTLSLDLDYDGNSKAHIPFKRADSSGRQSHDTFWFLALLRLHSISTSNTMPETFQSQLNGNKFSQHVAQTTYERRFFLTKMGYMGLGPDNLLEGDKVFVLAGGRVPFILRDLKPASNQPSALGTRHVFQILGDAYLHGIMDGEAMKTVDKSKEALQIIELK